MTKWQILLVNSIPIFIRIQTSTNMAFIKYTILSLNSQLSLQSVLLLLLFLLLLPLLLLLLPLLLLLLPLLLQFLVFTVPVGLAFLLLPATQWSGLLFLPTTLRLCLATRMSTVSFQLFPRDWLPGLSFLHLWFSTHWVPASWIAV